MLVLMLLLNILFAFQGTKPFESVLYWCTFSVVAFASSSISNKLEQIIKYKLHKMIKAKYP